MNTRAKSTLVVDDVEPRRKAIAQALADRGLRYLDVSDSFAAMAALGRADFGTVVAAEGPRTLSLRGLCQLARRRHPEISLIVISRDATKMGSIAGILGTAVSVLSPEIPPAEIARFIDDQQREQPGPAAGEPQTLRIDAANTTPLATVAPVAALSASHTPASVEQTVIAANTLADADQPTASHDEVPRDTLEGTLDGGMGPALLMAIFGQDLTGRLEIDDGPASGVLFFYNGDPVWTKDPRGDAGLHEKLVHKTMLSPTAVLDAVPEGQLLRDLVQRGALTATSMHEFMRAIVRDATLALCAAVTGRYRFIEDKTFLDVAPLLRLNPFGLILESRRKTLAPARLMSLSVELATLFAIPQPGLASAHEKLAPFVRGAALPDIIDGTRTVSDVLTMAALDPFMGTLVLVALQDAHLIALQRHPRASQGGVTLDQAIAHDDGADVTLVDANASLPASTSMAETLAREEIFALYLRMKPLSLPRQVLGVSVDADHSEIEAAYALRMRDLDPARIPEGSAQQILTARIEELRRKVMHAHQALLLQLSPGTLVAGGPPRSNPF